MTADDRAPGGSYGQTVPQPGRTWHLVETEGDKVGACGAELPRGRTEYLTTDQLPAFKVCEACLELARRPRVAQYAATPVPAFVSVWCRDCFKSATLIVARVPFCDEHADVALAAIGEKGNDR
jgi:hypothetical protein